MWEMPSLKGYLASGYNFKTSFSAYLTRRFGPSAPSLIWRQIDEIIADVFLKNQMNLIAALHDFSPKENFFEMVRFDFIIADKSLPHQIRPQPPIPPKEWTVFLMEVNMSPNLSSGHFPPNRRLYEQVLSNLFILTGIRFAEFTLSMNASNDNANREMLATRGDVSLQHARCHSCVRTQNGCHCDSLNAHDSPPFDHRLCAPCLDEAVERMLRDTYLERRNIGEMKAILPSKRVFNHFSRADALLRIWLENRSWI